FQHRNYNWETSVAIQHELIKGLGINAGYFRRWFGNFTASQNQLASPADYDPFCITLPVDSRLPNGGGNRQCGYYDVSPAKFGQTQNLVRLASNFGTRTQVYNGVDVTMSMRFPNGAQVSGGPSLGRTATNSCFVVNSPQDLLFCDVKPP